MYPTEKSSCLAAIFFLFVINAAGIVHGESREKPNVILIMADDLGWEGIGCFGAQDYLTPNIDSLAANGIRFSHCYSTPICTPSRVKLMTGQYNFRNYTHFGYLNPKDKTFGHLMQSAGYKTAIAGKWQLNGLYNELPGFDDSMRPNKAGFDESYLWQVTTGKQVNQGGGERFWSPPLERNGKMETVEENLGKYGPDLLCDFICDFIQRNRDAPFFVYYPMVLVHDPFVRTPDTIGDAPRTQEANQAPKSKAERKANFVAMVQYMDKIVGRIVAKVKDINQLENTIIIFTADNGTNTSIVSRWREQDIQGGKGGMTDMGTHVAMVACWAKTTPTGQVSSDLIDFTDVYPTLAEAAGVTLETTDPSDGRSFLPQIEGRQGSPRSWTFLHYQPYWNKKPGQFVRTQDFKLYRDGRYYRVPSDLRESKDLAKTKLDPESLSVREDLQAVLDRSPPAPTEVGNKSTRFRPTYPDWGQLADPND